MDTIDTHELNTFQHNSHLTTLEIMNFFFLWVKNKIKKHEYYCEKSSIRSIIEHKGLKPLESPLIFFFFHLLTFLPFQMLSLKAFEFYRIF